MLASTKITKNKTFFHWQTNIY